MDWDVKVRVLELLDVGGVGSLGVHTCCERAICSLAVSFCFFFAVGWDFDDDAFRRYGGAARLRWFLTVFVDLF
jgi:hypothetical protein